MILKKGFPWKRLFPGKAQRRKIKEERERGKEDNLLQRAGSHSLTLGLFRYRYYSCVVPTISHEIHPMPPTTHKAGTILLLILCHEIRGSEKLINLSNIAQLHP